MKRLILALCLTAFVPLPAAADEFAADSTLRAATVYPNRATLTRRASVDLPAGKHIVVFNNLPASLLPDSLRAEGEAGTPVTFGALSHKSVSRAELAAPREKELNDQLETLQDQRKGIEAEKQALAAKKAFLQNLSNQAALRSNEEIAEINLKPDQWGAAAETIHAGVGDILKADLALDVNLRTLDRQIQKIQNELNQLYTGQYSTYQVTVPLEVSAPTSLTIDLSYQIPEASWRPLYDARLDTEGGELELIQYGAVRQNTGEDWKNVALTLSTAQPQQGAGLPPMTPMWVSLFHPGIPAPMKQRNMAEFGAASSVMMAPAAERAMTYEADAVEKKAVAQFVAAEIRTGGFISEYVIPGPSSVAADGTESKLMIGPFKTDNKIEIHIKPQLSTAAIVTGRAKLLGDAPILPGEVSLFRDGAYVGQDMLPLLRPGEESKLSFGVDDQVSVERHVMKDEFGEAGVIAKDSTQERHFETIVRNLHGKPVDVVVFETMPVAQDDKIRVEILPDVTTAGYKTDTDNIKGLLSWSASFPSKAEKKIRLGWKVSWPKDFTINGL